MKFLVFFSLMLFIGCSIPADEPKHLLSKNEMAEIIADLAIYNQGYTIDSQSNPNDAIFFVFKKYNITVQDFKENYQYYIYAPASLDEIYAKSKQIILDKEPQLKGMIKEGTKKNIDTK